jgi:hypothetical protein
MRIMIAITTAQRMILASITTEAIAKNMRRSMPTMIPRSGPRGSKNTGQHLALLSIDIVAQFSGGIAF